MINPWRRAYKSGRLVLALLVWAVLAAGPISAQPGAGLDATAVIAKVDELLRGDTSYQELTMTVHNPDWPAPRSYQMKSWEDVKNQKSFIRIVAPPRDRGKAFLKDGYVFKVYIPTERENKPMTIPPSLMLQPWMGSDFTNDDLVRESSIVNDYAQVLDGVETVGGRALIKVRLDPKPDAPVVWGKIEYWVDQAEVMPVRVVYYDEDGVAVRQMDMSEVKLMGGRKLPTRWEMKSLDEDKKGNQTVLIIDKAEFNIEIPPETFTEKNLTRRDWD